MHVKCTHTCTRTSLPDNEYLQKKKAKREREVIFLYIYDEIKIHKSKQSEYACFITRSPQNHLHHYDHNSGTKKKKKRERGRNIPYAHMYTHKQTESRMLRTYSTKRVATPPLPPTVLKLWFRQGHNDSRSAGTMLDHALYGYTDFSQHWAGVPPTPHQPILKKKADFLVSSISQNQGFHSSPGFGTAVLHPFPAPQQLILFSGTRTKILHLTD